MLDSSGVQMRGLAVLVAMTLDPKPAALNPKPQALKPTP